MNKKIMVLALAVVSAAAFALPSMAMGLAPVHLVGPKYPMNGNAFTGGAGSLSTSTGETMSCATVTGEVNFESSTTGTLFLRFHGCSGPLGVTCQTAGEPNGTIVTTVLPFHLVTLPDTTPGILITNNNETKTVAHFECFGVKRTIEGNGIVGSINKSCGATGVGSATMTFASPAHGVQALTKVHSTETMYQLTLGGNKAAENASGTVTLKESGTVECT
jgi:hypothetical protein